MAFAILSKLFQERGEEGYIGEPVTQLQHMSQSAELARASGASSSLIGACLLHDVGHLLIEKEQMGMTIAGVYHPLGTKDHELVGAEYLRSLGITEEVCDLVEQHVKAKRYLISTTLDYPLSQASQRTLELQGGRMTPEEQRRFEQRPNFRLYLQMRRFDELAKENSIPSRSWESYRELIAELNREPELQKDDEI